MLKSGYIYLNAHTLVQWTGYVFGTKGLWRSAKGSAKGSAKESFSSYSNFLIQISLQPDVVD